MPVIPSLTSCTVSLVERRVAWCPRQEQFSEKVDVWKFTVLVVLPFNLCDVK